MMKSNILMILNFYPTLINMMMIMILIVPYKNYKFNPINLILMLILLTLLISIKINLLMNSWISFILFLIMIGGLMIIFMYITSLVNNELFKLNYKNMFMNLIKMIPLMLIFMIMSYNMNELYNNNNNWFNMNMNNFNINFYQIYMYPYNNITNFIMIYLFYSMICIMNICYKLKLPMRQLNI